MQNPLLDTEFLINLFSQRLQEKFVKLISLDQNENPVEEIQGKATSGSINVDGSSAVRRSCSLNIVANEINIHYYYWGLHTKFRVYVGLKNFINPQYDDIIWFPQGVFLITSFNTKQATNSWQISISGKDKMCLLNGDIGGNITSLSHDFGKIDRVQSNGTIITEDYLIKDIIREGVHTFGNEPYHNIIINDLDEAALELLEYKGNVPFYIIFYGDEAQNFTFEGDTTKFYVNGQLKSLTEMDGMEDFVFYPRVANNEIVGTPTIVKDEEGKEYTISKIVMGGTVGYRSTELVYAGDFIGNLGDSFTSACLDKIVTMLGEYEYFYNLNGQFVFQRRPNYINMNWNNIKKVEDETWVDSAAYSSASTWFFENTESLISVQNTPNYQNLKNDFAVWGVKNEKSPIHMRYAIDKKPVYYKAYNGNEFYTDGFDEKNFIKELEIQTSDEIINRIKSFEPVYNNSIGLTKPKRNLDGSWTPGWWDIRDWYEYYSLILQDSPNKTMKWYSYNSPEGCIELSDLSKDLEGSGYNVPNSSTSYVWLIIVNPRNKTINLQHGSGNITTTPRMRTLYTSYLDDQGEIQHIETTEKKLFMYPYAGCDDKHTFLDFLKNNVERDGNLVYFYNPNFYLASAEMGNNYEEMVQKEIEKELNEYLEAHCKKVDWREIIYQMAYDYFHYGVIGENGNKNYLDSFLPMIAKNNPDYYPTGYTGYEQYYSDIYSFWRTIYNPYEQYKYKVSYVTNTKYASRANTYYWFENCKEREWTADGTYFYLNVSTLTYVKRPELSVPQDDGSAPKDYLDSPGDFYILRGKGPEMNAEALDGSSELYDPDRSYYKGTKSDFMMPDGIDCTKCWNYDIYNNPENLIFWFDFLSDEDSELASYQVNRIGDRPKTENNDKLKSMYFIETPTILFYEDEDELRENRQSGYKYLKFTRDILKYFTLSTQGISIKDEVDNLLYKHTYCSEQISLTSLPIYHLQPNTRIFIKDDNSGINGEYIIKSLTIPLTYNGTMTITATKAVKRIH